MSHLSEREFILRAVTRVPNIESRHVGLRLAALEPLFIEYFGEVTNLSETLGALVQSGELIAAHVTWKKKPANVASCSWSAKVDKVVRLSSFPDPQARTTDPVLYLPGRSPARLWGRLEKTNRALNKILAD